MPTTLTHLHFRGNCSEAFRFCAATSPRKRSPRRRPGKVPE